MDPTPIFSVFGRNINTTCDKAWVEPNVGGDHSMLEQMSLPNAAPTAKSPAPAVKPKRPLSAYNLFFQAERKRVQASLPPGSPKIAFTEMAKIISRKWKVVDQGYKSQLMVQARMDKMRYDEAMKKYRHQLAEEVAFLQEQEGSTPLSDPADEFTQAEKSFQVNYFTEKPTFEVSGKLELPPVSSSNTHCGEHISSAPQQQPFLRRFSCAKGVPPLNQMEQDPILEMMTRPTNMLPDASIQGLASKLDGDMKSSIISLFA